MDVVFVTHNELGLACLEELAALDANVRAVYTRPQRENIADQIELESFTEGRTTDYHEVESVNEPPVPGQIADYDPDLLFVVGWSRLVSKEVFTLPNVAALGMHPAPLPRGRGRAPLAWSIIKGLDETALSMFHLVEKADAGDIVGQEPLPIDDGDDAQSLYDKMIEAGRSLVQEWYPEFEAGNVPRTPQDDADATWWPKREPHHGLIDWTDDPGSIYDWIRGQSDPYPGAFSYIDGRKVTIWGAYPPDEEREFTRPGRIRYRDDPVIGVGAWEGTIELREVQLEDGPRIPAAALLDETPVSVGDCFETDKDRLV